MPEQVDNNDNIKDKNTQLINSKYPVRLINIKFHIKHFLIFSLISRFAIKMPIIKQKYTQRERF